MEAYIAEPAGGWRMLHLHLGRGGRPIDYSHFDARKFGGQAMCTQGSPNSKGGEQLVRPYPAPKTLADIPAALRPHVG